MVQTHNDSMVLRFIGIGLITVSLLGAGVLLISFFFFASPLTSRRLSLLLVPMLLAIIGAWCVLLGRRFRFVEARQQVVRGENSPLLLAAEQPLPNNDALPLPCIIQLGPRWGAVCEGFLLILLALEGLMLLNTSEINNVTLLITLLLSVAGATLVIGILLKGTSMHIEVTEVGLRVTRYKSAQPFVRWESAQLFAILPADPFSQRTHSPVLYELSNTDLAVRWKHISFNRPFSFLLFRKPQIPFDEYDRQMEALLSLIAAKTGLPLYDLR